MKNLYKLSEYYKVLISHFVNTNLEVAFLDEVFKKRNIKTVLDIACGVGRHDIPLAKKGYTVTGIDFSVHQIKKAEENAEGVNIKFILQNANTFSYPEKFDAAICMWTTLGEEPLQYKKVIRNVFKSLKKNGIFVIDNNSWEYIVSEKEKRKTDEIKTDKGTTIKTEIYDRYTEKVRIRDGVCNIDGKEYKDVCITHILKERDWLAELKEAGFADFEVFHDYKRERVEKPHRVIIVAVK